MQLRYQRVALISCQTGNIQEEFTRFDLFILNGYKNTSFKENLVKRVMYTKIKYFVSGMRELWVTVKKRKRFHLAGFEAATLGY